jgi:colanic acid/amylovoran biosynthesis glycosyltransferase
MHIGYVVKRYPRFSETFIVNEILAHERAGIPVHIFAVRRVNEPHFQSIISEVRAPVSYISDSAIKAEALWATLKAGQAALPDFWAKLEASRDEPIEDIQQAIQLALQAKEVGITHFHAHFATLATSIARLAARFAGMGFSFTAHAKDIFHNDVDGEALQRKLTDADRVITVSDYNVDWLSQCYGASRKIHRIYNGLPLAEFPYSPPAERPRKIVAVGRLVPKKGFGVLIHACAAMKARGLPFQCVIIGEGVERSALELLIAGLDLISEVTLAGALPRPDVMAALKEAAVCVAPCVVAEDGDRDGLPTILVEAMALGTPCVSTDVTGIAEIVRHGETGLIVPQHDPEALAEAMSVLLADAALRGKLAQSARQLVEEAFDVDRNAAELRALFANEALQDLPPLRAFG